MTDQARIDRLVQTLRQDVMPNLSDRQLTLVLGWLAGSQAGTDAEAFKDRMGVAGEDQRLTRHVYAQVDAMIFRAGRLSLNATGLTTVREQGLARRRFRLLLSAFHPDRMQWHADWLTPRFQAINQAYRDFKLNPEPEPKALQTVSPASRPTADPQPPRYQGISPGIPSKPARWRLWARDQWLGHKIVGVMSLLVVLPLLSWSLEGGWFQGWFERDRLAGQDDSESGLRAGRATDDPPTVESLLEHWNLVLVAESSDAEAYSAGSASLSSLPSSSQPTPLLAPPSPPRTGRGEAAGTVRRASVDGAHTVQAGSCQAAAPADRFGSWLSEAPRWSLKDTPIGARPSRLQPGAIAGHALADAMENYRRSVEAGNMAQLLRNYVEMPRANMQQGERWLEATYGALFSNSTRRSLSLEVVEAYRHGDGWNVVTQYRLGVRLPGCSTDHVFEQELRFYLVQDPLLFRVAAVDY